MNTKSGVLLAPTKAAVKCSVTIQRCGSTCTLMVHVFTYVLNAEKHLWKARSWSVISSYTQGKSHSSVRSKAAENDSHLILIYELTFVFILEIDLTFVHSTAATRNLPNPQISSLTSSRTPKPNEKIPEAATPFNNNKHRYHTARTWRAVRST